jgi:beta-phosphoglucomutase
MSKGCVIFDFDGVIADTESLHLDAYNHTLERHAADIGGALRITPELYFGKYIVYGDREGVLHMLADHHRPADAALILRLATEKHEHFERQLHACADPLPGVRELLFWLEARSIPRAICSGARRGEIESLLETFKIRHHFDALVSIEDVRQGKPDPEGYNLCFERLNLEYDAELRKEFSLVIEDSAGGCAAARAAGLRVLGVATSLSLDRVREHANFAVGRLDQLDWEAFAEWLGVKA